jgi:hypothetical protein
VELARAELARAPHVVDVVRVAAVDQHVARREEGREVDDHLIDRRGRNHDPHCPRLGELRDELPERRRDRRARPLQQLRIAAPVVAVDDAVVTRS